MNQQAWDTPHIESATNLFLSENDASKGCLLASLRKETGVWLPLAPVSSLGLCIDDDTVRIAAGLQLGSQLCTPHQCARCVMLRVPKGYTAG